MWAKTSQTIGEANRTFACLGKDCHRLWCIGKKVLGSQIFQFEYFNKGRRKKNISYLVSLKNQKG